MTEKLRSIIAWFRRRRLMLMVLLVILAVVLWMVARVIRNQLPATVEIPRLTSLESHTGPVEVVANTAMEYAPRELRIYSTAGSDTMATFFNQAATQLGLNQTTTTGSRANVDATINLDNNAAQGYLSYSNDAHTLSAESAVVDLTQAEQTARAFLVSVGYPEDLVLNTATIQYFIAEPAHFDVTTDPSEAVAVGLSFIRQQDGVPVRIGGSVIPSASVITSSTQVAKATLPPLAFRATARQSVAVKTRDELVAAIAAGDFVITSQIQTKVITARRPDVEKLILNDSTLEYRLDERQQLLIPYVSARGEAVLTNDETVPIEIITPAISIRES